MSSVRFITNPLTKDLVISSRHSIKLAGRVSERYKCSKWTFSDFTRQSPVLYSQTSTMATVQTNYTARTDSCLKCVTLDNMNPAIKVMEYAVRGPLVIRASEIEKELEKVRLFVTEMILK